VVLGYAGHLWSHGIDASGVRQHLDALMEGRSSWRADARAVDARLLFWGRRESAQFHGSARPWEDDLVPIASGPWGLLYELPSDD
jgi:hypothetical protein